MTTQTQIKPFIVFNLFGFHLSHFLFPDQSTYATSLEYGFDYDEDELGRELLAPLPANVEDQSAPLIEAEEFDALYKWFIS